MDTKTSVRRAPQQARSKDTVEAILIATARVLVKDGFEKLSTNRVARVAGVSVGSLYQYFGSKHELIEQLIERRAEAMLEDYTTRLSAQTRPGLESSIRVVVEVMVESRRLDRELTHALRASGRRHGAMAGHEDIVRLVRHSFAAHADRLRVENLDLAAFLVVSSIEAAADTAVIGRPDLLEDGALQAELVELLVRYLVREPRTESGVRPALTSLAQAV